MTQGSSAAAPIRDMGPLETMFRTPAFASFWSRYVDNLSTFRDNLQKEARLAASRGENARALAFLNRAEGVQSIITKTARATDNAVAGEQEKRHGRSRKDTDTQDPGYAASGI